MIDSNASIVILLYYIGIASCAAQGAEKAKHKHKVPVLQCVENAFAGGFIRDTGCLRIRPWLFTLAALPDVIIVIILGCIYADFCDTYKTDKKKRDIMMRIVTIGDRLGLGSFICIGMDYGFEHSDNALMIILCGVVTAIGGGVVASVTSGKSLMEIFNNRKTIRYYFVTILGCCNYYIFRHAIYLICFVVIGLFWADVDYGILRNLIRYNLIRHSFDLLLLCSPIWDKNSRHQKQWTMKNEKNFKFYFGQQKLYIMQRRIRQC